MDTTSIITILAIILFILIALNHIKISQTTTVTTTEVTRKASCSQTSFGCCPDGVNSKINFYGTNCPGYRPPPGYLPTPNPPPPPPNPIGGCSGTRYGCCPNNITTKVDIQGSNCLLK